MSFALGIMLLLLLGLLLLVSYAERLYFEMGKFLSREFEENITAFEQHVEPRLGVSRPRAALSLALLGHLTTAAIALIVAYSVFEDAHWSRGEILEAGLALIFIIVLFNRLLPHLLFARTRGLWLTRFTLLLRLLIFLVLPLTLVVGFFTSVATLTQEGAEPQPESSAEAVDALIEAGREEGILEESDRVLIQSVVEFGDKTVREVMTPRPEVVAVAADATVEQFVDLLHAKPYSRVPVYDGSLDNVQGVVFAHDVLQVPDSEARTRLVRSLMKPVHFVPETKRVSELLRELQRDNAQMAVVIDEYGGVAGVVTIEDMVEEIVGEIRDEHEATADIVRETDTSYLVPGNMDLDRLGQLFGVRPEHREATTVGGLVSELLGRIPAPGEVVQQDGLRFEVLDSTPRRVERLRVSLHAPAQPPAARA